MANTSLESRFKWRTKDGQVLEIEEMETRHVYMCMKMLYNHLAIRRGWKLIGYTKSYGGFHWMSVNKPKTMAYQCVVFILEIKRRGDLADRYRTDFDLIMQELQLRFQKALPNVTEGDCGS